MKKIDSNKKILLDADVIIHFCKGDCIGILPQIYPNKYFIPDVVYKEALSVRYQTEINNLLHFKFVEELEIKSNKDVAKEYLYLTKVMQLGKGESACMAYCKYNNDVVGSSNLRDITRYCEENGIIYLTTMDFLEAALDVGKMSLAECDKFIYEVKLKRSKLPYSTMDEYFKNK